MHKQISIVGVTLFMAHTLFVLFVHSQRYEGSWGGFLIFVVDFPFSLVYLVPVGLDQWFMTTVFGGAWWYFLGTFGASVARNVADRWGSRQSGPEKRADSD